MSYLPTFAGSRRAPPWFHNKPTLRSQDLWRGLVQALVPVPADANSGATGVRTGRELVQGWSNSFGAAANVQGEACGPAIRTVNSGIAVASKMPHGPPLSCFAFLVNRDTNISNIQAIVGDKQGGAGGAWTFQLSYGSGQLGLTRWGIADNATTVLGAVPVGGAHSVVGLAWSSTNARFFLNGRFENVASGAANGNTAGLSGYFMRDSSNGCTNASFYVVYVWERLLSDGEFLRLMQDPWALVRPPELSWADLVAGGGGGSGVRAFIPAFIG